MSRIVSIDMGLYHDYGSLLVSCPRSGITSGISNELLVGSFNEQLPGIGTP